MLIDTCLITFRRTLSLAVALAGMTVATVAPAHSDTAPAVFDPPVIPMIARPTLSQTVAGLDDRRVVFVGETHTRFDHHLVQLQVLKALHQRHGDVAIGVEWFQAPFQRHLDDYLSGVIPEVEMLERTGYYDRWRFDYRLYRPIIEYARANNIPMIALNASAELTQKIGDVGIAALPDKYKSQLPRDYDRSNQDYAQRLRRSFEAHPNRNQKFENFLDVMLTWDETMAERATDYLQRNPNKRMVIFAGSGHVTNGGGIPGRLKRRLDVATASLLIGLENTADPDAADFVVLSPLQELPPPALLGAFLEPGADGLYIMGLSEDGAIGKAGIEKGDVLLTVAGRPMTSFSAVKVALMDHLPGDTVEVRYRSTNWIGNAKERTIEVTLGGPNKTRSHP